MRIYGGHDYYDCGLRMGIDPTITLIRGKSKSVPVEKVGETLLKRRIEVRENARWGGEVGVSVAVVFCGNIYRGFLVPGSFVPGREQQWDAIWSAEKFWSWVSLRKVQKNPVCVGITGSWRHKNCHSRVAAILVKNHAAQFGSDGCGGASLNG